MSVSFFLIIVWYASFFFFFFFNDTATTEIYTLSLHDALPISPEPANVISFSKARRRSQQRRGKAARAADHGDAQLILPLLPTQPALQSAPERPSGLRIIQRSPQEQPECLFISGRMADVRSEERRV